MSDFYTVVNRTSETRTATWDGRPYELAPHAEQIFPEHIALAFKKQNIQMGSLDPRTGRIAYLVGFKEEGDPITPLEQTDAVEVWDRSKLIGAKPSEVVAGDNGLYATRSWRSNQGEGTVFQG